MRHLSRTAIAVAAALAMPVQAELLITEYVEGYNDEKALEITNMGSESITLDGYQISEYYNGSTSATGKNVFALSGSLAKGESLVLVNSKATAAMKALADVEVSNYVLSFTGDDALVLFNGDRIVDSIGKRGEDPGSYWGTKTFGTQNNSLRRKSTVTSGRTDADSNFDPSVEWVNFPHTDISGLGCSGEATCDDYVEYQPPELNYPEAAIADINGDLSTLVNQEYLTEFVGKNVKVKGLVTYKGSYFDFKSYTNKKFAIIQAADDSNNNTPDGIRLEGDELSADVGQTVWVQGTVEVDEELKQHYHPLPYIQVKSVSVAADSEKINSEDLATVTLKGDEMPNQYYDSDPSTFDPHKDGNDFLHRYAGMKVTIQDPTAVTHVNKYGDFWVVADRGQSATGMTGPRGGMVISPLNGTEATATEWDYNPEVIKVIDSSTPTFGAGTTLETITGFLTWNNKEFTIYPEQAVTPITAKTWPRQTTELVGDESHLTVSNFNVENLIPTDSQSKFDGLAKLIVGNLKAPDIIALQEVGDDSGKDKNDGVVDSDDTLNKLVDAIKAEDSSIDYGYTYISPEEGIDGGKPGLNIRVAYLYNKARVGFVESENKAGPSDNGVVMANGELSFNPVRVNTDFTYDDEGVTKQAFAATRKTLATQFVFNGQRITLLNNHWSSKRGEMPVNGKASYEMNPKRNAQAQAVREFIDELLAQDPNAKVVALGDMNEFYYNEPLKKYLSGAVNGKESMHNLTHDLPLPERYSYVFGGNTQELDHLFVSDSLLDGAEAKPVHVNAEYQDQMSDHDPMVAKLMLKKSKEFTVTPVDGKNEMLVPLSSDAVAGDIVKVSLDQFEQEAKVQAKSAGTNAGAKYFEQTITDEDIKAKALTLTIPSGLGVVKGDYELSAQLLDANKQFKSQLLDKVTLHVSEDIKQTENKEEERADNKETDASGSTSASTSNGSSGGSFGFGALLALAGLGWTRRRRA